MKPLLSEWKKVAHPVIGMLHAPALPGSPGYRESAGAIHKRLLIDAAALEKGGVNGLMIENFGDTPFFPGRVPAEVVAHLTVIAQHIRSVSDLPLGINVLRNDGLSALAIAHAVGAQFVRVNVLCGARVTDQGVISGIAHDLLRLRKSLDAESIKILADVDVKHSAALAARPIEEEVADMVERGGADAVIVSGSGTGKPTDPDKVRRVVKAAGESPVFIGSGANESTIDSFLPFTYGFIVGTSLKRGGRVENEVDVMRVRALMKKCG